MSTATLSVRRPCFAHASARRTGRLLSTLAAALALAAIGGGGYLAGFAAGHADALAATGTANAVAVDRAAREGYQSGLDHGLTQGGAAVAAIRKERLADQADVVARIEAAVVQARRDALAEVRRSLAVVPDFAEVKPAAPPIKVAPSAADYDYEFRRNPSLRLHAAAGGYVPLGDLFATPGGAR